MDVYIAIYNLGLGWEYETPFGVYLGDLDKAVEDSTAFLLANRGSGHATITIYQVEPNRMSDDTAKRVKELALRRTSPDGTRARYEVVVLDEGEN